LGSNPTHSLIQLENFNPDLDQNYQASIVDLSGKVVKTLSLMSDQIDISELQNGLFILNIEKEGQQVFKTKFMVQK